MLRCFARRENEASWNLRFCLSSPMKALKSRKIRLHDSCPHFPLGDTVFRGVVYIVLLSLLSTCFLGNQIRKQGFKQSAASALSQAQSPGCRFSSCMSPVLGLTLWTCAYLEMKVCSAFLPFLRRKQFLKNIFWKAGLLAFEAKGWLPCRGVGTKAASVEVNGNPSVALWGPDHCWPVLLSSKKKEIYDGFSFQARCLFSPLFLTPSSFRSPCPPKKTCVLASFAALALR